MNCIVKSAICVAAGLGGCILAQAGDNTTIAARNVFGLLPQEVIVVPPQSEAPLPKIVPDGIMTVFGRPQALFKVVTLKTPAGNNLAENFFVLGEGESEGDIKVVQIDMEAKEVTFSNHGTLQRIPLTDRK